MCMPAVVSSGSSVRILYPRESYDSWADPKGPIRMVCQSTTKCCCTCLILLPYDDDAIDDVVILALSEYLCMYMPTVVSSGSSVGILYPRESYDSWEDLEGPVRAVYQSTAKCCCCTCLILLPYDDDDVVISASC
jgi:hypothetical protein